MSSSLMGMGPTGRSSGLKGTGYRQINVPNKDSGQMDLIQQLMGGSKQGVSNGLSHLSQLASGGTEDFWNKMEVPAQRGLSENLGNIASRFSAAGGRNSSGFQNAVGEEARTLSENLAANRSQMQQSAIKQLMELSQMLLGQDTHDSFLVPKQRKKSLWEKLIGSSLSAGGTIGGALLGGPFGAQLGSQLGHGLGSAFF